jgi:plasmid stability protein
VVDSLASPTRRKPERVLFVRLDAQLHQEARVWAARRGMSIAAAVRDLVAAAAGAPEERR